MMGKIQAPFPPEHLRAIGQIAVNFALLEDTISVLLWEFVSIDQKLGQIITAELSFRNLVGLLSSLHRYRTNDSDRITELDLILSRALNVEEQRNKIMHSVWASGDRPETITRFKSTAKKSKGLLHQFDQVTVEDLDKIADLAAEVAGAIQAFWINSIY